MTSRAGWHLVGYLDNADNFTPVGPSDTAATFTWATEEKGWTPVYAEELSKWPKHAAACACMGRGWFAEHRCNGSCGGNPECVGCDNRKVACDA